MVALSGPCEILEIDRSGKILKTVKLKTRQKKPHAQMRQARKLLNGNTVVCNWGGHGHVGQQPQIFEVTPDKKVVWQVYDYKKFTTISNIHVLDVKADPTKGKILR
ncbi:MAG: hypothetical protein J7M40_19790 [Planctomycetes bacterium]|nr:hypothetical protein [Planctomycetota bacterium]